MCCVRDQSSMAAGGGAEKAGQKQCAGRVCCRLACDAARTLLEHVLVQLHGTYCLCCVTAQWLCCITGLGFAVCRLQQLFGTLYCVWLHCDTLGIAGMAVVLCV